MGISKTVSTCVDGILDSQLLKEIESGALREHEKHLCIIACLEGMETDIALKKLKDGEAFEIENKNNFLFKKLSAAQILSIYRMRNARRKLEIDEEENNG